MENDTLIFKIIKSMSMNEKRYFKIGCTQHTIGSQNKYVLLFDLIDAAKNYDKTNIKKALKDKQYATNYLASDINYLLKMIMKALNDFHSEKTCDLKIKQNLISIEILFYKGLYQECLYLISKTKRIKLANESQYLILELLSWEKKCLGYSKGLLQAIEVNNKLGIYFDSIQEAKIISDLYYKSYFYKNSVGKVAQKTVELQFEELIKSEALVSISEQATIHTIIFYNLIFCNYYHVKNDKIKELEYLRTVIGLFDEKEIYKFENPLDYISVYIRIIDIKKRNESQLFYQDLIKLRAFKTMINLQSDVASERIFLHTSQAELEHLLNFDKLDAALLIIGKIQETIVVAKFNIEPYYMISLYYLFASIHCANGNFSAGLKYINIILNEYKFSDRPNTFIKAEFLNVIIHYELKNHSLVLKNSLDMIKKYNSNFKFSYFERQILKTIKTISENPHIVNDRVEFGKVKNKIQLKFPEVNSLLHNNYMKYILKKAS